MFDANSATTVLKKKYQGLKELRHHTPPTSWIRTQSHASLKRGRVDRIENGSSESNSFRSICTFIFFLHLPIFHTTLDSYRWYIFRCGSCVIQWPPCRAAERAWWVLVRAECSLIWLHTRLGLLSLLLQIFRAITGRIEGLVRRGPTEGIVSILSIVGYLDLFEGVLNDLTDGLDFKSGPWRWIGHGSWQLLVRSGNMVDHRTFVGD